MESTSIIHGINEHHVINKHQECYSIIDNIVSLITTFKRYALVCFIVNFVRPTGPMVTMGHQVPRWAISASSGQNELGKKFSEKTLRK